jgi:hypothetical protein
LGLNLAAQFRGQSSGKTASHTASEQLTKQPVHIGHNIYFLSIKFLCD